MARLAVLACSAALAAGGLAAADHPDASLGWPALLPARDVPGQSDPAEGCADPSPACVDAVIQRMQEAWAPLDAACHPRAVFALTYLRTTQGFREALDEDPFDDEEWIIRLDAVFADLYFDAARQMAEGDAATPPAWRVAFEAADAGRTSGGQDVLLGMNAHIQRDLPVALHRLGLVADGVSHKPDHDRVNDVLAAVVDPIEEELAERYDPAFEVVDAEPSPADEMGTLELIKAWREGAWRNAERLAAAGSPAERAEVMASIESYSEAWARAIAAPDSSRYAPIRRAYCEDAHA